MPFAIFALSLSAFGIGTTEMIIVGLLPEVGQSLNVSVPTAGLLVTGYALGVVIGAVPLTALTNHLRRKHVLIGLMVLFVVGNVISALAPNYAIMLTGRIVAALCHGSFFGVGAVVAAEMVAPKLRSRAISMMISGLTLSTVLGVPLGTLVGQQFGWRTTFWLVALISVIALLGILRLIPNSPVQEDSNLKRQFEVFRRPGLWLALLTTTLGFGGVFASFTYLAPMVTDLGGFATSDVTWLTAIFGIGMFAGNLLGGRTADRSLDRATWGGLVALSVVLFLFTATIHNQPLAVVTLLLVGLAGGSIVPALQSQVLEEGGDHATLASAANIGAFNLGNAIGAFLGAQVISAGLGYGAVNVAGGGMAAAGLLTAFASVAFRKQQRAKATAALALAAPRKALV